MRVMVITAGAQNSRVVLPIAQGQILAGNMLTHKRVKTYSAIHFRQRCALVVGGVGGGDRGG